LRSLKRSDRSHNVLIEKPDPEADGGYKQSDAGLLPARRLIMGEIALAEARENDAELLAQISARAFQSDLLLGASEEGGPPGYNSREWQQTAIKSATAYLKILLDEKMVGGVIVFARSDGSYYLARMFVDPRYHRQGLGLKAVKMLLARYPEAWKWTLDTPAWNVRTRNFYEKLGFLVVAERDGLLFYEKAVDSD
jgi:GNAT superfamily N-acetyltransferase